MRPLREGPNSSVPSTAMFFLTKSVCETESSKNTLQGGTGRSGCQNGKVPEEGKIHLPYSIFANLTKSVCETKTSKNTLQGGTGRSGCQNGKATEEGQIHLPYSVFANFIENDFSKKQDQKSQLWFVDGSWTTNFGSLGEGQNPPTPKSFSNY